MKTIYTIFLLLIYSFCFAQNNINTITYSYKHKNFLNIERLDSIKAGDFFQIRVINVNPNKTVVKDRWVASKKEKNELPNILSTTLSALAGSVLPLSLFITSATGTSSLVGDTTIPASISNDTSAEFLKEQEDRLKWTLASTNEPTEQERECFESILQRQLEIKNALDLFIDIEVELEQNIMATVSKIQDSLKFSETYSKQRFELDLKEIDELRNDINNEKKRINGISRGLLIFHTCISDISSKETKELIKTNEQNIGTQIFAITKELDKMLLVVSDSIVLDMKEIYEINFKIEKREYTLPVQRFDEGLDSIVLSFHNKADGKLFFVQRLPMPVSIKQDVTKFSASIFISTLGSEAYSVRENSSFGSDLVKENNSFMEFGVSAGINHLFHRKEKATFLTGIAVGASYSDKVRPRILLKGGLALGEDRQYLLTTGLVLGYKDVKSELFKEKPYEFSGASSIMVSKFSYGLSISLGYFL